MKFAALVVLLIALLATLACAAVTIPTTIKIKTADHKIFLDTNFEYQVTRLTITNTGAAPINSFIHVIHSGKAGNVSYVRANGPNGPQSGIYHAVHFTPDFQTYPQLPQQYRYYQIHFQKDVQPQGELTFEISTGFHNTYTPSPAQITQTEAQKMLYRGYTQFFSMYPIAQTTTTAQLSTSAIEAYSPRRGVEKADGGKRLVFPTIRNTATAEGFDIGEELIVHAQNHAPFYHFTTATRHFDVATTGLVNAIENYEVRHAGAQLKGPFHRYLHERNAMMRGGVSGPEISSLTMRLPRTAMDIEFRDFNGNISTSRISTQGEYTNMQFQLRYPLYGGWKSDFEVVYNFFDPQLTTASADEAGRVTIAVPFGYPFADANGHDVEIRVLLPEGAEGITWTTPFDIDSVTTSTIISYKDTIGRTAVTFKSKNITPNMNDNVRITYVLPTTHNFLTIPRVAYLVALFLAVVLFFTFVDVGLGDYNITPTQKAASGAKSGAAMIDATPGTGEAAVVPTPQAEPTPTKQVIINAEEPATTNTTTQRNNKKSSTRK